MAAKASAVSGVNSAGFSTTVLPAASAGAIFQASISSGKFHGMICPHTPTGLVPGKLAVDQRGPTGVMVEMAGDQRNVDVARLTDRLAVVDRFQNGQKALPLLHMARERINMLRPLEAGKRRPFRLGLSRRGDGGVDVLRRALRNARDALAARGIEDIEQVAGLREDAVDEMPEAALCSSSQTPTCSLLSGEGP